MPPRSSKAASPSLRHKPRAAPSSSSPHSQPSLTHRRFSPTPPLLLLLLWPAPRYPLYAHLLCTALSLTPACLPCPSPILVVPPSARALFLSLSPALVHALLSSLARSLSLRVCKFFCAGCRTGGLRVSKLTLSGGFRV